MELLQDDIGNFKPILTVLFTAVHLCFTHSQKQTLFICLTSVSTDY